MTDDLFTNPAAPCCLGDGARECVGCPKEERALRAIVAGVYRPMTESERAYCRREITSVEGYSESDTGGSDYDVASAVLSAWADYCRDMGML